MSIPFSRQARPLPPPEVGHSLRYTLHPGEHRAGILLAGDWAPVREFSAAASISPAQLYGPILAAIHAADLSLVNLELPLASGSPIIKDGPAFAGDPAFAQALADAGWSGVSLANNHARDQGVRGVQHTIAACEAAGLLHFGAGGDREAAFAPLIVERQGLRLGFLAIAEPGDACASHLRGGAADSNDPVLPLVMAELRAQVDTLVVIAHGGLEYAPLPPPYWYDKLVSMIDYGADAVVAHHPHIPPGMSLIERPGHAPAPILWSLGNFIFPPREADQLKPPYMHLGYTARLELSPGTVHAIELTPYHIINGQGLAALDQPAMQRCARMVEQLSQPLLQRSTYEEQFAQVALRLWKVYGRERVRGLTAMLCNHEAHGFKHGQSHFACPAHYQVYHNAIESLIAGVPEEPELQEKLEGWYAGTWPH